MDGPEAWLVSVQWSHYQGEPPWALCPLLCEPWRAPVRLMGTHTSPVPMCVRAWFSLILSCGSLLTLRTFPQVHGMIRTRPVTHRDPLRFSGVSLRPAPLPQPSVLQFQPPWHPWTLSPDSSVQGAHQAPPVVPHLGLERLPTARRGGSPPWFPASLGSLSLLVCGPVSWEPPAGPGRAVQSLFLHLDWKWKLSPV